MNSRGIIPIADLKKHYDEAVADYPKTYEKIFIRRMDGVSEIARAGCDLPESNGRIVLEWKGFLEIPCAQGVKH